MLISSYYDIQIQIFLETTKKRRCMLLSSIIMLFIPFFTLNVAIDILFLATIDFGISKLIRVIKKKKIENFVKKN